MRVMLEGGLAERTRDAEIIAAIGRSRDHMKPRHVVKHTRAIQTRLFARCRSQLLQPQEGPTQSDDAIAHGGWLKADG